LPHIIDGKEVECKLAVPKDPPKDDKKRKKKKKKSSFTPENEFFEPIIPSAMRVDAEAFQMHYQPEEIYMDKILDS